MILPISMLRWLSWRLGFDSFIDGFTSYLLQAYNGGMALPPNIISQFIGVARLARYGRWARGKWMTR